MDQNISTLLAALIGGLLTIAGGLVANYYLYSRTTKLERRKEIRQVVEEIYTRITDIEVSIRTVYIDRSSINNEYAKISNSRNRILTLTHLYLPSYEKEYNKFNNSVNEVREIFINYRDDLIDENEYMNKINMHIKTLNRF